MYQIQSTVLNSTTNEQHSQAHSGQGEPGRTRQQRQDLPCQGKRTADRLDMHLMRYILRFMFGVSVLVARLYGVPELALSALIQIDSA